jgi:hypothetical protein
MAYFPAAQLVHVEAPAAAAMLVIDPAVQIIHDAVLTVEYLPARHLVQPVAPVEASVLVIDPAAQEIQVVWCDA